METRSEISFGLVDVNAKNDLTATAEDKQPFVKMTDLALEGVTPPPVATGEYKYWRLDKSFIAFPDNPELISWGLWSLSMSNADGVFETPIVLNLDFEGLHSSMGISFEFNPYGPDYCTDLNIKWYKDTELLFDLDFQPDRWNYSAMQKVENFNKIVVTFKKMNKSHRYLKVQNIIYGILKYFTDKELTDASTECETDITGETIPYNKLTFSIYSLNNEFNIFNPQGVYTLLQKKQQLNVTGFINDFRVSLGTFFVDEMSQNDKDQTIKIEANDAIAIMDGTYFNGGIYKNKKASKLVGELMLDAGFGYILDDALGNELITGYIPYTTHREALQMIAFALRAYVDTSRLGVVTIKKSPVIDNSVELQINNDRKYNSKVRYDKYVSGVDVTVYEYTTDRSEAKQEVFKGIVKAGTNFITFSNPVEVDTISTSAGTILKKGVNFCELKVGEKKEVTISAYEYVENTQIVSYRSPEILAGEKENILEKSGCTLINVSNALDVAKHVYDIAQLRIKQTFSVLPYRAEETPGLLIGVQNDFEASRKAIITKTKTDIFNGILTQIETKGV